ncbi:hypothetical protein K461DRAFT_311485 [Myriangium duriaei CBS 260.36]|uniref:F-box domain-containing protein n=1 Tax=Myriangium duriaei CBS 260.36 TaxID=1168546 RepID=A0A9P4J4B7_9PEZI|nr:hypothetical protein K461DRAFT_311485 [Myriangium duriaei CBS 260.36]
MSDPPTNPAASVSDPTAAESELENFRRRWREEVSSRSTRTEQPVPTATQVSQPALDRRKGKSVQVQQHHPQNQASAHAEDAEGRTFHDLPDREEHLKLGAASKGLSRGDAFKKEPQTALEHYEKAVENEAAGKLGDSLKLYRQAFKLDDNVHEKYKHKHFPPSAHAPRPAQPNPSNAAATVPSTAHHSLHGLESSISQLIHDFSTLSIPAVEPPTDASPQPPCPIADLPSEILTHILDHLAQSNVAAFTRLSLVCKRFAYLAMTEEQIWKAVALSTHQGIGGMHYDYTCDVYGKALPSDDENDEDSLDEELQQIPRNPPSMLAISNHLLSKQYSDSWRQMYRTRPRIRFHGVYISTVHYTRPGGASTSSITWSTPVHVVTYYRYLRFFRDGTCISLLTTAEPIDVVHILTKENMSENNTTDPAQTRRTHHVDRAQTSKPPPTSLEKGGSSHAQAQKTEQPHALPSSQIMKDALRGRWRLSGPGDGSSLPGSTDSSEDELEAEGDLHVETEGVVPRYMYKMQFAIGSLTGGNPKRGSKNNRLSWKGFWSYNRLTDDWSEFVLKNDRAYHFSRVKSYGVGG